LEIILLLAELEELKDNSSEVPASALVIESSLHPQKGPLATLLVKQGILEGKKMKSVSISKARLAKKQSAQVKEAENKAKAEAKKQEVEAQAVEPVKVVEAEAKSADVELENK